MCSEVYTAQRRNYRNSHKMTILPSKVQSGASSAPLRGLLLLHHQPPQTELQTPYMLITRGKLNPICLLKNSSRGQGGTLESVAAMTGTREWQGGDKRDRDRSRVQSPTSTLS